METHWINLNERQPKDDLTEVLWEWGSGHRRYASLRSASDTSIGPPVRWLEIPPYTPPDTPLVKAIGVDLYERSKQGHRVFDATQILNIVRKCEAECKP